MKVSKFFVSLIIVFIVSFTGCAVEDSSDQSQTSLSNTESLDGPPQIKGSVSATYYSTATGKTGDALKAALHEIINDHTKISYDAVWWALNELDEDPNNSNNVIHIYTRRSVAKYSGTYDSSDSGFNREHTWPKSHGFPTESWPAYTDLHHLRVADVSVNSSRGTKDYDNGGTTHSEATLCKYTTTTWEVPDEVKGDIARQMFYMAVRYEGDRSNEPDLELVYDPSATDSSGTTFANLSTLIQWHNQDPVSTVEMARNDKIYSNYQGNRNPFIDHPEWVASIWGGGSSSDDGYVLQSGVTATDSLSASGDSQIWTISVPSGTSSMRVVLDSGSNDYDFFASNTTSDPSHSDNIFEGYTSGGEDGSYSNPTAGTWYIKAESYSGSGSYSLTVTLNSDSSSDSGDSSSEDGVIFEDNFDDSSLKAEWTTTGSATWRIQHTSSYAPRGEKHIVMDSSTNGTYATNQLILNKDLSSYANLQLEYYYKESGDENHSQDGVYVYSNGSWQQVKSFNSGPGTYTKYTVDLSAYSNITKIMFQQYDNYGMTTDGICIDDVKITAGEPSDTDGSTGSWQTLSTNSSSPNYPSAYPNDSDVTETFSQPGATQIRVHFAAFDLENNYDYVYILDSSGNQVAAYTGSLASFTSATVNGDTLKVRFVSDYSITKTGYQIDRIEYYQ